MEASLGEQILDAADSLAEMIETLPEQARIDALNVVRKRLHQASPLNHHPIDCVIWAKAEAVGANDYNPNKVAPPEMALLKLSIEADGYTQPIVTHAVSGRYEIVDGFHRHRVGREDGGVSASIMGRLPVTEIKADRTAKADRIAATIRHNRARGKHSIEAMSEIVVDLTRRNWSDHRIARELGMEPDEVLRLKQVSGLAEMFGDQAFSEAWEIDEDALNA